ncbi:MAG: glycosyltransferase family 4 protein [Candidatus Omnitrophica bacterium]|nr:glycosyltransferase family 4 protein [Candidatus Omnitrophota bacterium]
MKVLMISEYFYPFSHGGSEWSTYYLAKSLIKKGFKVFILTPNYGSKNQQFWQSIQIYRLPFPIKLSKKNPQALSPFWLSNFIYQMFVVYWIIKTIIRNKIDIVHVQGNYFIPSAYIASLILKKPRIVTLRDYIALCPYGFCLNEKRNYRKCNLFEFVNRELPYYLKIYSKKSNIIKKILILASAVRAKIVSFRLFYILKCFDKVICISKKQQKIFKLNGLKNTIVIYNSFEGLKKPQVKPKNYIFYAGRLTPGKGIDLLVKSFTEIVKKNPGLRLLIAGDGLLRDEIESFIKKNNLRSKIILLGQISHAKVLFYLRQAKVCVVPSVWEEPFGRVALEAQFLGIPVVATKQGGLPEIVIDKKTGYLVEPNVKSLKEGIIKSLKSNLLLRKNLKKYYHIFQKKFQTDVINKHLNLYQSL